MAAMLMTLMLLLCGRFRGASHVPSPRMKLPRVPHPPAKWSPSPRDSSPDEETGEQNGLIRNVWKAASPRSSGETVSWWTTSRKAALAFVIFVLIAWIILFTEVIDTSAFHSSENTPANAIHLSPAQADVMRLLTPVTQSVRLPQIFSSHMVLQRDKALTIWGWAKPGSVVKFSLAHSDIKGESGSAVSDFDGKFEYPLQQLYASSTGWRIEVHELASAHTPAVFVDVAFGDVILCAGEANVVHTIHATTNSAHEIADAVNYPLLRMFTSAVHTSTHVASVITSKGSLLNTTQDLGWVVSGPKMFPVTGEADKDLWSTGSAVCFYTGRTLQQNLKDVTIGVVVVAHHHAAIDAWSLAAGSNCKENAITERQTMQLMPMTGSPSTPSEPSPFETLGSTDFDRTRLAYGGSLFRGMFLPLAPLMKFVAVVWYQGETDALEGEGPTYECKLKELVGEWRDALQESELPFFIVQLAARVSSTTAESGRNDWALVQQAQERVTHTLENTFLVTAMDVGDSHDSSILYPANKAPIGYRIATAMLKQLFDRGTAGGPIIQSIAVKGATEVVITFSPLPDSNDIHFDGTPLCRHHAHTTRSAECCQHGEFQAHQTRPEQPSGAWITPESTTITSSHTVTLHISPGAVPDSSRIDAVRYAYSSWPQCALYNGVHLPLPAFLQNVDEFAPEVTDPDPEEAESAGPAEPAQPAESAESTEPAAIVEVSPLQPTHHHPVTAIEEVADEHTETATSPDSEDSWTIVGVSNTTTDPPELMSDMRMGDGNLPTGYPFRRPPGQRNSFYLTAVPNRGAGLGHQFGEWINGPWVSGQTQTQYVWTGFGMNSRRWNGYFNFQMGEPTLSDLEAAYGVGKIRVYTRTWVQERMSQHHAVDWVRITMEKLRYEGRDNPEIPEDADEAWKHLEREVPFPVLFQIEEVHVVTVRQACEASLYATLRRKYCLARLNMPIDVDLYKVDRTPHPPGQSLPKVIVAFHLRCGDSCFSVYRSTPFDSILYTAERIRENLHQLEPNRQMAIHLFSQKPDNDTAEHHFEPLVTALKKSYFSTVRTHFTAHSHTTLHHLVTADVIVGAQSSFSWVGFLLHHTVSMGPFKNCFHSVDYQKDTGQFNETSFREQYSLSKGRIPKFDSIADCEAIEEQPSELYEYGNFTLPKKEKGTFRMIN